MTQVDTAYDLRLIPTLLGFVCEVPEELPAELVEPEEFGNFEVVEPEFVVVGSAPGFGGIRALV